MQCFKSHTQGIFLFRRVVASKWSIQVVQLERHMQLPNYLTKSRHGIWYYRWVVPPRIRAKHPSLPKELKRSTKTADIRIARVRARKFHEDLALPHMNADDLRNLINDAGRTAFRVKVQDPVTGHIIEVEAEAHEKNEALDAAQRIQELMIAHINARTAVHAALPPATGQPVPAIERARAAPLISAAFEKYAKHQLALSLWQENTASSRQQRHYKPYTSAQLLTIFKPHAYLAFNRDADYFWGPLLALHLGARLGEIVTLPLDAVQQQPETGIWYLTVIDAKNANSERTIPVSQPLVRLGFGNYVRHLRRLGAKYLFPHRDQTTTTAQRDPSKNCSRHFARYLGSLGLDDNDLVFHSFRHVVVTALQDGGTPPHDSMQIVGHAAQDHALKTGQLSTAAARSVHYNGYSHPGQARLNVENPLARLKSHLDRCIQIPLDYARLRLAARIVTEHTVASATEFRSGWSKLKLGHTAAQVRRLR